MLCYGGDFIHAAKYPGKALDVTCSIKFVLYVAFLSNV